MSRKPPPVRRCLNCKGPVPARFCAACGQRHRPAKMPIWSHVAHIVGEHLLFDSRMARTVLPFLFRPGLLTREYNAGRRVRYSAPVRIYLLMSLVLFLTLGVTRFTSDLALMRQLGDVAVDVGEVDAGLDVPPVPGVEGVLEESAARVDELARMLERGRLAYEQSISETLVDWLGEDHPLCRWVDAKLAKLESMGWARARLAGFDNWLNLLPTAMFLLLPFCAVLSKLCFVGRGLYYVEHLVFSLHLHAFIYLVLAVLQWLWRPLPIAAGTLAIVLYALVGLITAFRGWPPGTLARGVLFVALYVGLLVAALGATFGIALMLI